MAHEEVVGPAEKGPLWDHYKDIYIARMVERIKNDGEKESGVVRFPAWKQRMADGTYETRWSVRWADTEGLEHYTETQLRNMLLEVFLDSAEDVPREILDLQNRNWHPEVVVPPPAASMPHPQPRSGRSGRPTGTGNVSTTPTVTHIAPHPAQSEEYEPAASQQDAHDQVNNDHQGHHSTEVAAAAAAGNRAGAKRVRPATPGKAGKKAAASEEEDDDDENYASGREDADAEVEEEEEEGDSEDATATPAAKKARSAGNGVTPASKAKSATGSKGGKAGSQSTGKPRIKQTAHKTTGRPSYNDSSKWVKGWNGKYYPADLARKLGDKKPEDINWEDEAEGEFVVDAIMDEVKHDGVTWYLVKWEGYQLRPGVKPKQDQSWEGEDKGDWEPASNIPAGILRNWKKKKPAWYADQK